MSREYADGAGLKFSREIWFLAPEVQVAGGWKPRRLRAVVIGRGSRRVVVSSRGASWAPREESFVKVDVGSSDETVGGRYPDVVGGRHIAGATGVDAHPGAGFKAGFGIGYAGFNRKSAAAEGHDGHDFGLGAREDSYADSFESGGPVVRLRMSTACSTA